MKSIRLPMVLALLAAVTLTAGPAWASKKKEQEMAAQGGVHQPVGQVIHRRQTLDSPTSMPIKANTEVPAEPPAERSQLKAIPAAGVNHLAIHSLFQ